MREDSLGRPLHGGVEPHILLSSGLQLPVPLYQYIEGTHPDLAMEMVDGQDRLVLREGGDSLSLPLRRLQDRCNGC